MKKLFSKKRIIILDLLVIAIIILVSIFYLAGIKKVPFHPDESTQIFMSSDFDIFFKDPRSLFWSSNKLNDLRQHYRVLDAPVTRSLIGLGRWMTHSIELKSDWDWSKSWEANLSTGALPSEDLLLVSRLSVTVLFPFSLFFLYLSGIRLQDRTTGFIAILLFSTNSLILLHTRRAMAESSLVFFTIMSIFFLFFLKNRTWLCAIPIALAFNSKQTTLFLILSGFFVITWRAFEFKQPARKLLTNYFLYIVSLVFITFLLNPFLWANPLHAVKNAVVSRVNLTNAQVKDIYLTSPDRLLNTPIKRIAGLIGNLFIQKPAVQDVANYVDDLQTPTMAYMQNPFHSLFRSFIAGSILLLLSILGCSTGIIDVIKKNKNRNHLIFLLVMTGLALVQFLATVRIPYQRYVIIFIPLTILWISFFISKLISGFQTQKTASKKKSFDAG